MGPPGPTALRVDLKLCVLRDIGYAERFGCTGNAFDRVRFSVEGSSRSLKTLIKLRPNWHTFFVPIAFSKARQSQFLQSQFLCITPRIVLALTIQQRRPFFEALQVALGATQRILTEDDCKRY